MLSEDCVKTVVVIGAGPGLGMSIAHRFGREGHAIALLSRTAARHASYLSELAGAGIEAAAFPADVRDRDGLLGALAQAQDRFGRLDVLYYGPGAADPTARPEPITETTSAALRDAMAPLHGAVDAVGAVLPGMLARGDGGLLFAGGLSAVLPLPPLGALALVAAALRNYALTLHAAVADRGVYAGTLTIGGLVERGDIHRTATAAGLTSNTLDPDAIADAAWDLYTRRHRPEATFNTLS